MQETWSKEELWAELDALGEDEVRTRLVTKIYGDTGHKKALVQEWLRKKQQEKLDDQDKINVQISTESLRVSKSAKNASWAAVFIALVAVIVSGIALYFSK